MYGLGEVSELSDDVDDNSEDVKNGAGAAGWDRWDCGITGACCEYSGCCSRLDSEERDETGEYAANGCEPNCTLARGGRALECDVDNESSFKALCALSDSELPRACAGCIRGEDVELSDDHDDA
jgi:hypothetical protein